jgi:hypothetical protein
MAKKPLTVYSASRLTTTVWRATPESTPTERDFYSYSALGREMPTADYLRLTAVSMFLTPQALAKAREDYGLPPESVELDLRRDSKIRYAVTNPDTGHIEVWAPPDVLLACVTGRPHSGS